MKLIEIPIAHSRVISPSYIRTSVLALAVAASAMLFDPAGYAAESPSIDMERYRGKVVYVDFWASWCAPCRESFPWMEEMSRKYGDKGLVVLTINLDKDKDLAAQFLHELGYKDFSVIYDPSADLARQYKVAAMPSSFLLDRKGNLRFTHKGFHLGQRPLYEEHITTLLGEIS